MADERVSSFLKALNIKTVKFGGFDKTATFETLKALSDLYETILEETRRDAAEAAPVTSADLALKNAEIDRLRTEVERLRTGSADGENHFDAFNQFMTAFKAEKSRQDQAAEAERAAVRQAAEAEAEALLNEARTSAEGIVSSAKIEAMREKSVLADELEAVRSERKAIYDELYLVQEQIARLIQSGKREIG